MCPEPGTSKSQAEPPGPQAEGGCRARRLDAGPAQPGSPSDGWDQARGALALCPHAPSPRCSASPSCVCSAWSELQLWAPPTPQPESPVQRVGPLAGTRPGGKAGGRARLLLLGGGPRGPHCLSVHCLPPRCRPASPRPLFLVSASLAHTCVQGLDSMCACLHPAGQRSPARRV